MELRESYLNFTLIGVESLSLDAKTYSVFVGKPAPNQEFDVVFVERTSISRMTEFLKFGRDSEETMSFLKSITLGRTKARIALKNFDQGADYTEEIKGESPNTSTHQVEDQIVQQTLLRALANVRKTEPQKYKSIQFDIKGFCHLLNIPEDQFHYNASILMEGNLIESELGIDTDSIFITKNGLENFEKSEIDSHLKPSIGQMAKNENYVDIGRIKELESIKNGEFDLMKLIQLCRELNSAHQNKCYMSIAMILRAIIDHIPPILGVDKFSKIANNFRGAKSFKESMHHLDNSLRKIADLHLHVQIRKKEALPTFSQVNFSADLDVLLAEVVRILK